MELARETARAASLLISTSTQVLADSVQQQICAIRQKSITVVISLTCKFLHSSRSLSKFEGTQYWY